MFTSIERNQLRITEILVTIAMVLVADAVAFLVSALILSVQHQLGRTIDRSSPLSTFILLVVFQTLTLSIHGLAYAIALVGSSAAAIRSSWNIPILDQRDLTSRSKGDVLYAFMRLAGWGSITIALCVVLSYGLVFAVAPIYGPAFAHAISILCSLIFLFFFFVSMERRIVMIPSSIMSRRTSYSPNLLSNHVLNRYKLSIVFWLWGSEAVVIITTPLLRKSMHASGFSSFVVSLLTSLFLIPCILIIVNTVKTAAEAT